MTTSETRIDNPEGAPPIVSVSPKMERIMENVERVASTDVQVLILGESGVGKELLARRIHYLSNRAKSPFVKVNCSALPDTLVESELFGHERGAFTGATERTCGKFELAGSGTILLDEIGEMELQSQAKLLHVLQDREFSRVGGKETIPQKARVLATTNRRLDEEAARNRFREDLYFRLAVILVEIPPLRERREDIPVLAKHFLRKYGDEYGTEVAELPQKLLDAFLEHDWPGNVREVENVIRRYLLLRNPTRTMADLQAASLRLGHANNSRANGHANGNGYAGYANGNGNGNGNGAHDHDTIDLEEGKSLLEIGAAAAEEAERRAVLHALDATHWNRKEAAKRLNVCYKTLLNKLNRWDLDGAETGAAGDADGLRPGHH